MGGRPPLPLPLDFRRTTSVDEATALHTVLKQHEILAGLVAAAGRGTGLDHQVVMNNKYYLSHDRKAFSHGAIRLRSIRLNIAWSQQVRDSIDWDRVSSLVADAVLDLVYRVPELIKGQVVFVPPGYSMELEPHNNVPPGVAQYGGLRRIRCHPKKQEPRRTTGNRIKFDGFIKFD